MSSRKDSNLQPRKEAIPIAARDRASSVPPSDAVSTARAAIENAPFRPRAAIENASLRPRAARAQAGGRARGRGPLRDC